MKDTIGVALLYMIGVLCMLAAGGHRGWLGLPYLVVGAVALSWWSRFRRPRRDDLSGANDEFMWLCVRCELRKGVDPERYYAGYSRLLPVVEREARKHVDAYAHRVLVFVKHHVKTIEPEVLS